MGFPRGMKRDRVALERRRMRTAQLLKHGHSEAEVARQLGVHRLLFPSLSRHHPHCAGGGLPDSSIAPASGKAAGYLRPFASTPGAADERIGRRPGRPIVDRVLAWLCTGTESGGISVGLLETSRTAQLLPRRPYRTRLLRPPCAAAYAPTSHTHPFLLAANEAVTIICKSQ